MAVGLGGKIQGQCKKKRFHQIKLGTCAIPHIHWILTCKSFDGILSMIQGDLQGQRVSQSQVK